MKLVPDFFSRKLLKLQKIEIIQIYLYTELAHKKNEIFKQAIRARNLSTIKFIFQIELVC